MQIREMVRHVPEVHVLAEEGVAVPHVQTLEEVAEEATAENASPEFEATCGKGKGNSRLGAESELGTDGELGAKGELGTKELGTEGELGQVGAVELGTDAGDTGELGACGEPGTDGELGTDCELDTDGELGTGELGTEGELGTKVVIELGTEGELGDGELCAGGELGTDVVDTGELGTVGELGTDGELGTEVAGELGTVGTAVVLDTLEVLEHGYAYGYCGSGMHLLGETDVGLCLAKLREKPRWRTTPPWCSARTWELLYIQPQPAVLAGKGKKNKKR